MNTRNKRQQQLISELQQQWDLLSAKLAQLEKSKIIEVDPGVRFKLEQMIPELEVEREQVKQRLIELEDQPMEPATIGVITTTTVGSLTPYLNEAEDTRNRPIQVGQVFGNVVFQILTPKIILLILIAIAVIAAGVLYWRYIIQKPEIIQKPAAMTGDFNIAIAEFGELNENGKLVSTKLSSKISLKLTNYLESAYGATDFGGLKVQVAHDWMPIILDAQQAEKFAADVRADLVIYGNVVSFGNQSEFSPMFYIAGKPDTQELAGIYETKPIPFDLSSQEKVLTDMHSRAAILVDFTRGLIFLSKYLSKEAKEDLSAAADLFQSAIRKAKEGQPFKGQEVLYLFMATTYRLQKNFAQSTNNLDITLRLNPQYARAYIARGHIYYEQAEQAAYAEGNVQQALDRLESARTEYNNALAAPVQTDSAYAYIREKAYIGIGHVYTARAQITQNVDLYKQAIEMYQQGVASYENTRDKHLQALASIGYNGLGRAYEYQEDYVKAYTPYRQCVEIADEQAKVKIECLRGLGESYNMQGEYAKGATEFQKCVDLTIQSPKKSDCYAGLGTAYKKQGNRVKATEAYQQCITLADTADLKTYCETKLAENQ